MPTQMPSEDDPQTIASVELSISRDAARMAHAAVTNARDTKLSALIAIFAVLCMGGICFYVLDRLDKRQEDQTKILSIMADNLKQMSRALDKLDARIGKLEDLARRR